MINRRSFLTSAALPTLAARLNWSGSPGQTVFIAVPYRGAAKSIEYWAIAEEQVDDWEREGPNAERCTVAFAASELRRYLQKTAPEIEFRFTETLPESGAAIVVGPASTVRAFL